MARGVISCGTRKITNNVRVPVKVKEGKSTGAHRARAEKIGKLTNREREIVELIAEGLKNKEIAARLSISPATVRHHLSAIFAKLDVENRLKLVVFAYRNGFANPGNS